MDFRSGEAKRFAGEAFDHIVIPYTFGESIFHPVDQGFCKDIYSLPHDKRVVLFAASYFGNHRKGMDILIDAIETLSTERNLVFCASRKKQREICEPNLIPGEYH